MRHTTVIRAATLGALLSLATACSDAPTAAAPQETPAPLTTRFLSNAIDRVVTYQGDTAVTSFTVLPDAQTTAYLEGDNWLMFPAGSLCEPNASTYGPTEWNKPCVSATRPITITVKAWLQPNGRPRVDVQPELRFVPSKVVMLYMHDATAAWLVDAKIRYCATPTSSCVDESLFDATVATGRDPVNGRVFRRVKHFSGYNIAAD